MTEKNADEIGIGSERMAELTGKIGDQLKSRRGFLGDAAKVGGGALALSFAGSGAAAATGGQQKTEDTSDVDILNYALTLEHLEYAFYRDGLEMFDEKEFERSDAAKLLMPNTLRFSTYNFFEHIRDHEKAHVDTITEVVGKLGGEPVSEATYDFPYENIEEFVGVAMALENTGVAAYAGAAPMIENDDILSAALSIHSVEARHAGYLNLLNEQTPFPAAFDEPKTMDEVLGIAGQFIVE